MAIAQRGSAPAGSENDVYDEPPQSLEDFYASTWYIGAGWKAPNEPPDQEDGSPWWDTPESAYDPDDECQ